ncbi:hypothetical protein SODG_002728 [Sodalis praecaptivus]
MLYFHQKAKDARASAIGLKEAVTETTEALMALSSKQLDVKVLDLSAQYQNQITQRNQLMKAVQDYDSRLEGLSAFDPFGQRSGVEADKNAPWQIWKPSIKGPKPLRLLWTMRTRRWRV